MKLILVFILAFLLVVGICACEPVDHCRIDSTRCLGPVAQVCDANERAALLPLALLLALLGALGWALLVLVRHAARPQPR